MDVIIESLEWVHSLGSRQVGKISKVKYLNKSYSRVQTAERQRKADDPMHTTRGDHERIKAIQQEVQDRSEGGDTASNATA